MRHSEFRLIAEWEDQAIGTGRSDKLKEFQVVTPISAHCAGIEAVTASKKAGIAAGSSDRGLWVINLCSGNGIHPGELANCWGH